MIINEINFLLIGTLLALVTILLNIVNIIYIINEWRIRRSLQLELLQGQYDSITIRNSTKYYIKQYCTNIDPAQEQELRHALVATRESIFSKVDYFINSSDTKRHLLILADSGTGKTSFVLNYYARYIKTHKKKNYDIAIVSLALSSADEYIKGINKPRNTVIILDSLDEDIKAIINHKCRIMELMRLCASFKRIIITCRTQFFPIDEEIPIDTGVLRIDPLPLGTKGTYEFWKLYLSPFNDDDIDKYIKRRYHLLSSERRRRARAIVKTVPLLAVRPMLLAYIADLVNANESINTQSQLYAVMIDKWLDREEHWVSKTILEEFSKKLAVEIIKGRMTRGMERLPVDDMHEFAKINEINIEKWQIQGRSLLNRDALGNYKFAHRSILEYLFVLSIMEYNIDCEEQILSDQMKVFLFEKMVISVDLIKYIGDCDVEIKYIYTDEFERKNRKLSRTYSRQYIDRKNIIRDNAGQLLYETKSGICIEISEKLYRYIAALEVNSNIEAREATLNKSDRMILDRIRDDAVQWEIDPLFIINAWSMPTAIFEKVLDKVIINIELPQYDI